MEWQPRESDALNRGIRRKLAKTKDKAGRSGEKPREELLWTRFIARYADDFVSVSALRSPASSASEREPVHQREIQVRGDHRGS